MLQERGRSDMEKPPERRKFISTFSFRRLYFASVHHLVPRLCAQLAVIDNRTRGRKIFPLLE